MKALTLAAAFASFSLVLGGFMTVGPTGECETLNGTGTATYCCNGACIDGNYLGSGECTYFDSCCGDVLSTCPETNQVLTGCYSPSAIDSGDGRCYSDCQWQHSTYQWSCCDCPVGYYTQKPDACSSMPANCITCDNALEVFVANATGQFCVPICNIPYVDAEGASQRCSSKGKKLRGSCPTRTMCPPEDKDTSQCAMAGGGRINAAGLALLYEFSKCCPAEYTIGTSQFVGCGHNCTEYNDCYNLQPPVTFPEAMTLLEDDLWTVYDSLFTWAGVCNLNTNQYSALVDYAYAHGTVFAFKEFGQLVAQGKAMKVCEKMKESKILRDQADGTLCAEPTVVNAGCCG